MVSPTCFLRRLADLEFYEGNCTPGFFFKPCCGEVSFHRSPGSGRKCSLQRVGSQLEHVFPRLSQATLSESAGLLMRCWNLLLLDSYSWFWSGSSKEEVSISTASNVLWRYIFMTTQLIALFVPSGVWLLNKQPFLWVTKWLYSKARLCQNQKNETAKLN